MQHINRISVIAAGNTDQVIDYWNDLEVNVPTALVASPTLSDYEISGTYDNTYSVAPPNCFTGAKCLWLAIIKVYCVVKCTITNKETTHDADISWVRY